MVGRKEGGGGLEEEEMNEEIREVRKAPARAEAAVAATEN